MCNGVIDNSENRKKAIKCDNCGKKILKYTTRFEIDKWHNPLLNCNMYTAKLYYHTICKNCGNLVVGVMRKELDIKDIEKIFGV